jgi:hypothetical protein
MHESIERMRNRALTVIVCTLLLTACGSSVEPILDGPSQDFIIEVEGERFRIRVTDVATATLLQQRRTSGQLGVVSGRLVRGDGGFNGPWGWHLSPSSIEVPDAAIELCDGRPSMVQADLDYWVDIVRSYCPWSARVYGVD